MTFDIFVELLRGFPKHPGEFTGKKLGVSFQGLPPASPVMTNLTSQRNKYTAIIKQLEYMIVDYYGDNSLLQDT